MRNKKKFSALMMSIFMLVLGFSNSALAITGITSDITQVLGDTPSVFVNQGENFSVTLTAQNPIGNVSWHLAGAYSESDVYLSSETGITTRVYGTLREYSVNGNQSAGYSFAIIAYDDGGSDTDNSTAGYNFMILDKTQFNNGNPVPDNGGSDNGNVVPSPIPDNGDNVVPDENPELNIGVIEAVPELSDEVIQNLADNVNVDPSEITLLTEDDFDTSEPPEPTDAMRRQVESDNGQFAAKLNTIKVEKDGWYVFQVTVSDDLVGTKVSDLKLYAAEGSDFRTSSVRAAFGLMPIINGVTGALEVSDLFGVKLDTLPKQFLATMFLSASQSMTVYIVKILLMLLAGGCNSGFGLVGGSVFVAAFGVYVVKFFKKR